ncbi:MAG: hypothetical protein NUV50_00980 [Rhodospirillales bacterium]|nr:hypothetical protein [Rhodospirillales bacterium]
MQNGLYKVHFQTPIGTGAGVVVLHDGKISGGDTSMYYTGTYEEDGSKFTATVLSAKHTDYPGFTSVFGVDRANIHLTGTSNGNSVSTQGHAQEAPEIIFEAKLARICD